jgi:3-phosphoshikimate 1-carboxyvinyltransferase
MRVRGTVRVPGDKSISHRSLMFAALADGESEISGILQSADVASTAGVLRSLGASIPELDVDMVVRGRGLHSLQAPRNDLDCGNSGTTTRLMAGIVSGFDFAARFIGDESLSRRPMQRVARPLGAMGARVQFERGDGLPMVIRGGALRPIEWTSESASAQVKSAILLAALVGGVGATVHEPAPSRDHTERMLRARGVTVHTDGATTRIEPAESITPSTSLCPATHRPRRSSRRWPPLPMRGSWRSPAC